MLTRPDSPTTASRPLAFHPEQLEGASRAARRPAASPAEVAHAPPAQGATAPAAFTPTGAPAPARGSPLRTSRAVALEQGHRAAHGRRDVQMTGVGHGHPRARRASSASGRTRASVIVNVSVSVGLWGRAWSRVLVLVLVLGPCPGPGPGRGRVAIDGAMPRTCGGGALWSRRVATLVGPGTCT